MHDCFLPSPSGYRELHQCPCGQWWRIAVVNDVFTELPTMIWARVGWWDWETRLRIWSRYSR